jgi:membrane protein
VAPLDRPTVPEEPASTAVTTEAVVRLRPPVLRSIAGSFWVHEGFFLAGGLSFYIIICVVPFMLLAIAGGGVLLSNQMVEQEVLGRLGRILPVYQREVQQILRSIVETRGVSGLVGTLTLLLFATQVFAATRLVLNRVFGIRGRGFLHGMLFDLGMTVLLTLVFFATIGVTAAFAWMRGMLTSGWVSIVLLEWAGLLLGVGLDTVLFLLVYRLVPVRRIAWPSVLGGSLAAGILWQLAKQLFRLYIERVGVYSAVYGPLGVLVALIMWVYYSAVVFVLGAELVRALEERRGRMARV